MQANVIIVENANIRNTFFFKVERSRVCIEFLFSLRHLLVVVHDSLIESFACVVFWICFDFVDGILKTADMHI